LQETKNVRDTLELVVEQVKLETKEEKECTDRMKHGLKVAYNFIPDNAQTSEKSVEEKINLIVQTINQYKQDIDELKERLNPMTPLEELRSEKKENHEEIHTPNSQKWRKKQGE
jgi:FtsZ-binding cell division protein ZapB